MPYTISILRYLKIDIVLGGIISLLFFSHLFDAYVPWTWYALLGGGLWVIYMIDHLLDVRKIELNNLKKEHLFVARFKKLILIFICIILILMAIISIDSMDETHLVYGFVLLSLVIFYFTSHHFVRQNRPFPKEVFIAVVYSLGVITPAWIYAQKVNIYQIPIVLTFIMLALTNVLLFSFFDYRYDQKHQQHNALVSRGRLKGQKWINQLISTVVAVSILNILFGTYFYHACIQILMAIVLFFVAKWPVYFYKRYNYAFIIDGIFFLPLLIVIFS